MAVAARETTHLRLEEDIDIDTTQWNIADLIKPNADGVHVNELLLHAPEGKWSVDEALVPLPAGTVASFSQNENVLILRREGDVLEPEVTGLIRFEGEERDITVLGASYVPLVLENLNLDELVVGDDGYYPGGAFLGQPSVTHTWVVGNIMIARCFYQLWTNPPTNSIYRTVSMLVGFHPSDGTILWAYDLVSILSQHFDLLLDNVRLGAFANAVQKAVILGTDVFVATFLKGVGDSYLVRFNLTTGTLSVVALDFGIANIIPSIVSNTAILPNTIMIMGSQESTHLVWAMAAELSETDIQEAPVFSSVFQVLPARNMSNTNGAYSFSHIRPTDEGYEVIVFFGAIVVRWTYGSITTPIIGDPNNRRSDNPGGGTHVYGDILFTTRNVEVMDDELPFTRSLYATAFLPISDISSEEEKFLIPHLPNQSIRDAAEAVRDLVSPPAESVALIRDCTALFGDLYLQVDFRDPLEASTGRWCMVRLVRETPVIDSNWIIANVIFNFERSFASNGAFVGDGATYPTISAVDNGNMDILITDGMGGSYLMSTQRVGTVLFRSLPETPEEDEDEEEPLPTTSSSTASPGTTTTSAPTSSSHKNVYEGPTSVGAIIGYVVAAVFVACAIAVALAYRSQSVRLGKPSRSSSQKSRSSSDGSGLP